MYDPVQHTMVQFFFFFFAHVAFYCNHKSLLHIEFVVYDVINLGQVVALMVMGWQLFSVLDNFKVDAVL